MTSTGTGSDVGMSNAASAGSEYGVFLSFRGGDDTRARFADHLHARLDGAGIRVFKDDKELPFGGELEPELRKGIKKSKIAIPILSKGYAESRWCLDELVQIMEYKRDGGLKVMPIFYYISPADVRNQTGCYGEVFKKHGNRYDNSGKWRKALKEVGNLRGWVLQRDTNRPEADMVRRITVEVLRELKKLHLLVNEVIGLEDHAEKILKKIHAERDGLGVLGIYGMGGIGKTTLAKYIYNILLPQFERCSFVEGIRENLQTKGILFLMKKLICDILSKESADNIGVVDEAFHNIRDSFPDRKVLILLDDVDDNFEMQRLLERREWFAPGSVIILTTRHENIITQLKVDWPYELPLMHDEHARELFIKCAFQNDKPPKDYGELIEKAVRISKGLPLCLEVIGSLLRHQSEEEWKCTLEKLENVPPKDVKNRLNISFKALDERQQRILLDIACFFIGVGHRVAICFWDRSDFYHKEAIIVLRKKSLIKIGADNLIWMHDLMRDFCRDYINEGHIGELEKQRILWNEEEARSIFIKNRVAESVQGLFLKFDMQSQCLFTAENFAKLPNVKFLQVKGDGIYQSLSLYRRVLGIAARLFSLQRRSPLALSELRWLCWHHFPPIHELNIFSFINLVFLDLSDSSISDGWDRWSNIENAKKLKVLNLSGCEKLTKTPNFLKILDLEQLILERCSSLIEIDGSIRMLQRLMIINLRGCRSLCKLPAEVGDIKSLKELILDDTSLSKFPKFIRDLKCLSLLSLGKCRSIQALPKSTTGLVSLVQLDLSHSGIIELPDSIGNMKNLEILNVDGCNIRELPVSLGMLERLEVISAAECPHLESIPILPYSLISLTVCSEAKMKRIPDFSNLTSLKHLIAFFVGVLGDQPKREIIWNIGKLSELVHLEVRFPHIQILHGDLGEFSHLKKMVLEKCHRLRSIPKLPSSLMTLWVDDCHLLRQLPDLSHLKRLSSLHIRRTPIDKVEGLQMLKNLRELVFEHCGIRRLPDMSDLKELKTLEVQSCRCLVEIQGRSLKSLVELDMVNCIFLEKMPDIPKKETMLKYNVVNCGKFSSVEAEEEDPVIEKLRKAGYDFNLTEMIQKKSADENLSKKELFESDSIITPLFLLLLVLTLLAPKFLGLEPYRLSWLGIFLYLILLFILDGLPSLIF